MPQSPKIDTAIIGKQKGLGGRTYPVICHGLDAAAVATALWRYQTAPGLRRTISSYLGVSEDEAGRIVAYWAGIHDIGKVEAHFQNRILGAPLVGYPKPPNGSPANHQTVGCLWLIASLPETDYPADGAGQSETARYVAQIVGGHHGRFVESPDARHSARDRAGITDDAWDHQRRLFLDGVRSVLGDPPAPAHLDAPAAFLITGLVVLADWLASQEHFILSRLDTLPNGAPVDLAAHYSASLDAAAELIADAGLGPLTTPPAPFADTFPGIAVPHALQASVAEHLPAFANGPGLMIVTAPTGEGKTETGLFAADHLGHACGRPGRAFLLPTMATADSMHDRVGDYAQRRSTTEAPLMRLHSMAWLHQDAVPDLPGRHSDVLSSSRDESERNAFAPTQWLYGGLRGLLASWGVGTFDQAFLAVLRTRFNAVRMYGLAGKTVVVDEAHAMNAYMQKELERLLEWFGHCGIPVVLLSATLHRSVANAYAVAYLKGLGARVPGRAPKVVDRLDYPGWVHVAAEEKRPRITRNPEPIPVAPRPPLTTTVTTIDVVGQKHEGKKPTLRADRTGALRHALAPVLTAGGCAAVVCTTVAEAQSVYDEVKSQVSDAGSATEVFILHARFPQWQRERITAELLHRLGKEGAAAGERPRSAIVVATSVIEQSLDIDFDLMVSDLAPMALLLQRAGRCWRHEHWRTNELVGGAPRKRDQPMFERGPFTRPEVAVLAPDNPEAGSMPSVWSLIHYGALLERTHRLLLDHGPTIRIPEDVQELVERVHDDPELASSEREEFTKKADEAVGREMAGNLTVPTPRGIRMTGELGPMTGGLIGDEEATTRLGVDSVRVVSCFEDRHGRLFADRELRHPLPASAADRTAKPSRDELRSIMRLTFPVMEGKWIDGARGAQALPPAWRASSMLKRLIVVRQQVDAAGQARPATVGTRSWDLDPERGLLLG